MNFRSLRIGLSLGLLACFLASCSSIPTLSKLPKLNKDTLKNFRLSNLRRKTPPIVEVKKGSLQEIQSGEERILAYNRALKNGHRTDSALGEFFAPDDFDAGALPTTTGFPSLGLLPPLNPGGNSAIQTDKNLENLSTSPKAPEPEQKATGGFFSSE